MRKKILSILLALCMLTAAAIPAQAATIPAAGSVKFKAADISHYNTITDWAAVKANADAVYIKATEGVYVKDSAFPANAASAASAGIPAGYYHYFWPASGIDGVIYAIEQANDFYLAISQYDYQLIPVVDVEETAGCTAAEISNDVLAFCNQLISNGAPGVMIYCSPDFANSYLTDPTLGKYPLWIANYGVLAPGAASVWNSYTMWQYTSTGSLPGISGYVDLNKATSGIFLDESYIPAMTVGGSTTSAFTGSRTVLAYQIKLNSIRVPRPLLEEDGWAGPLTREAVIAFERVEGLTVDSGIWGSQCSSAYNAITAKPTLKYGSRGQAVRYLQYRLGLSFDGEFGVKTEAAVKAFQSANGLYPDGIVGPLTWAALIG